MSGTWIKRMLLAAFVLLTVMGFVYALMPKPVLVDVAEIGQGPLQVTVDEEGETRIREVYVVSAPIGGKVLRSPREVGDVVEKDKTVVAEIRPGDPAFLDVRRRRELQAAVAAAQAAVSLAGSKIRQAQSELQFAESDLKRAKPLAERGTVSQRTLEKAAVDVDVRRAALAQANADLELRKRELESARARLIGPEQPGISDADGACCVHVRAPVSGRVLKILRESQQVVASGEPLLEIGDRHDLEIVVDLLSTDAVKIETGAEARIEAWGGGQDLRGRVRRIDPAGFTKVSALGIEEQRVNTILDITDPPEKWTALGHDFRVFVRITVWSSENSLRVPLGALFRKGRDWAVFKVEDGRARLALVKIGHRNAEMAEVQDGLAAGDRVVLHPSDRIADGVRIARREDG
ncbi:MAG: HlyD family efflux transporter periplasmic adaptor subunit [Hyphomicrobiales bacterium]|nr:HlyD family efflux transporter periplasmic adaptor subunit [Hyphomicrobiales bacterium]